MATNLGLNGQLYRGTANATAATLMTNVKDLSVTDERNEADTTTRGSGNETAIGCMVKYSVEWEMEADDQDADYLAISTAYLAGTPLALKCLTKAGGKGMDADFVITKRELKYPLKEQATASITAKPTYGGATPRFPVRV